jgi:hypothetical protein
MAKSDPKDDRIAELELGLESCQQKLEKALGENQGIGALHGEIAQLKASVADGEKEIVKLKSTIVELQARTSTNKSATVTGLPENAAQLRESSAMVNSLSGARIYANAGDVIVAATNQAELNAVQSKVGGTTKCHPVSAETLAASRKANRVF